MAPSGSRLDVGARAQVAQLLRRGEETAHAQAGRDRVRQPLDQVQQDAHGGGVVVGSRAAAHRVVVRDQEQDAVAAAEVDRVGLAAALEGREAMGREGDAARGQVRGDRGLAPGVRPPRQQARERERARVSADDVGDRRGRRHRGRRLPAGVEDAHDALVQAAADVEADVPQAHGTRRRAQALAVVRAARSTSDSPRRSATRVAVRTR
jgi:hypothetical protein